MTGTTRGIGRAAVALALGGSPLLLAVSPVRGESTERVSVSSSGDEANGYNSCPTISADGRYVAFHSSASNLVPSDTNDKLDVFVYDRLEDQIARVSVSSDGQQGDGDSWSCSISPNGRYIAFVSEASNLASTAARGRQVFIHDCVNGTTECASVNPEGQPGNGESYVLHMPAISADGRYVAFHSMASNLVPDDTNGKGDVFVRDRETATTTRVSISSSGEQGNLGSVFSCISADGRYVAFYSGANNLVPDDTNGQCDVFVHDRHMATTTRVSISSTGVQGNSTSAYPWISGSGRYVAFQSLASTLVPDDTNGYEDVFLHDRETGVTTRVSVDSFGTEGNYVSQCAAVSADGRYVAFWSAANNLVPDDTNSDRDVFIHDCQSGSTTLISVDSFGNQGNDTSTGPAISSSGGHVAFTSTATNLVPDDTNGEEDVFVRYRFADSDADNDGVMDGADNCPKDANPLQEDGDSDGVGDVCDHCPDTAPGTAVGPNGCALGDLNCDGTVNTFDIDPFVLALTDAAAYYALYPDCDHLLADVNDDDAVNTFDIDPFVDLLTGP